MKKNINLLIALVSLFAFFSCINLYYVVPSGEYIKAERALGEFEKVSVSNGFELIITQNQTNSLVVETFENIHEYIIIENIGNSLVIKREDGVGFTGKADVKIYLSCDNISAISTSGGGKVNLSNGWSGESLKVTASGGGRIFGEVYLDKLSLDMSGGSRSELSGAVNYISISSSGGASHKHFELEAQECKASMSGGASAELTVRENLIVSGSGGTTVRYKGDPEISTKLSGGSSVRKVD